MATSLLMTKYQYIFNIIERMMADDASATPAAGCLMHTFAPWPSFGVIDSSPPIAITILPFKLTVNRLFINKFNV